MFERDIAKAAILLQAALYVFPFEGGKKMDI